MTEFQQHILRAIDALGKEATRDAIYRWMAADLNRRLVTVAGPGSSALAALYRQKEIMEDARTGVWRRHV